MHAYALCDAHPTRCLPLSSLLVLAALGLAFIACPTPWVPLGLSTAPGRSGSCGSWCNFDPQMAPKFSTFDPGDVLVHEITGRRRQCWRSHRHAVWCRIPATEGAGLIFCPPFRQRPHHSAPAALPRMLCDHLGAPNFGKTQHLARFYLSSPRADFS